MKKLHASAFVLALAAAFAAPALAADASCLDQAKAKKLSGAAKDSFVKKCDNDAMMANPAYPGCEKSATDKKLAGAAKTSHMKKCMADAAPPAASGASAAK